MITGVLHTHTLVVILFLLLYTVKTILLLAGKIELLDKVRSKTKVADMLLGTLILATGGFLLFNIPEMKTYHLVKLVTVLASIPMGIVAFKKRNKIMAASLLAVFIYVYGVAETKSLTFKKEKISIDYSEIKSVNDTTTNTALNILEQNKMNITAKGKVIYEKVCTSCHGADGKLGVGGAKDLTTSSLTHEQKVHIIRNGKNLMAAYSGLLTDEEIEAVATYVDGMKK
ncbi:MAG: SirB2 family protein [Cytophagaceae bacterium]|nr:SirB2 family protein [Cytophagaceae bacterium]MDW8455409.1 SirB2 family protein [Cytophagaceae bacterium]